MHELIVSVLGDGGSGVQDDMELRWWSMSTEVVTMNTVESYSERRMHNVHNLSA